MCLLFPLCLSFCSLHLFTCSLNFLAQPLTHLKTTCFLPLMELQFTSFVLVHFPWSAILSSTQSFFESCQNLLRLPWVCNQLIRLFARYLCNELLHQPYSLLLPFNFDSPFITASDTEAIAQFASTLSKRNLRWLTVSPCLVHLIRVYFRRLLFRGANSRTNPGRYFADADSIETALCFHCRSPVRSRQSDFQFLVYVSKCGSAEFWQIQWVPLASRSHNCYRLNFILHCEAGSTS